MRTILETPPLPRWAPDGVFDAFGWCASDRLEWRAPDGWTATERLTLTADNPPRMVFVMKRDVDFLPRELARLHAPGLGLGDDWALAPYGIDDATDELFVRRVPPGDVLWLAADSVPGLFWGLHDWAHFHNHGSFVQRAWTELQCDRAALCWLWLNRARIGLADGAWDALRTQATAIGEARFDDEGLPRPPAFDRVLLTTPVGPRREAKVELP